ncbi:peptidase family C50-domain-containing protein [Biscogniauxia sp. FL1348]|nr:peptidase family C50-domain-containing protein [Biscogniauxia sp. FL1348]
MTSLPAQADAVRAAVASVSTCTPAISATLKELLQGKDDNSNDNGNDNSSTQRSKSRLGKTSQIPARGKAATTAKQRTKAAAQEAGNDGGGLPAKEKAVLATQVINATLKALADAAKALPAASSTPRSPTKVDLVKSATRKALRRSSSMPMTPLQPRSLNRVSTSPAVARTSRAPVSSASSSCLATVECARVAFATLRSLQSSGAIKLPDLQLESGMSSFISKLIALDLFDQAVKELRILKRRLESMAAPSNAKKNAGASPDANVTPKTLSDLLDYPKVNVSGQLLNYIITAQLQALRVFHGLKKSAHLDSILPFLRQSNKSSPLNLLMQTLEEEKPDRTKCSRQLESLAQSLLSLTPSVATKDDAIALESRLNPSPETSLEAQALGLTIRLQSWGVSGHKGDVDKDILMPLSKCLATFLRRNPSAQYSTVFAAFCQVWELIGKSGLKPSESSKSPLAAIYQVLATASRESGDIKEATKWTNKLRNITNSKEDSAAKCCTIAAQLLALSLKGSANLDDNLIKEVLDGLQGSLSGNVTELDDLLVSICFLRKAVMNTLTQSSSLSKTTQQHLESFIFQMPRFALRWLGKPPPSNSATKEYLRFEQRRQLLSKYLHHLLDSALMLAKVLIDEERLAWDVMDSLLQDSLGLLEHMGDAAQSSAKSNPSTSYHVKISHLYYQQHLALRKSSAQTSSATSLRALRRSVDSVKHQPEPEQTRAHIFVKWERFAELCKASGRRDDAVDALRSIRDHIVRQDVVTAITTSLATQPVSISWQLTPIVELLSRSVCNLAKLDRKPNDWTWLLTGPDKATALEHDFYFILSKDSRYSRELDLSNPTIQALLQHYSPEEYPIRRLRTLLQLLIASLSTREQTEALRAEVETSINSIDKTKLANDSGLERYILHMQALASCVSGLLDADLESPEVKRALSQWKDMTSGCQSSEQLLSQIDDPHQLLTTLQSLADFARVQGSQTLLTDILELSDRVAHLAAKDSVELRVSQSTTLCLHYLSLGRSTKAEKALQSNNELLSLPDISREITASFHLSAAEYHLAIGAFDKAEQHLVQARAAAVAQSPDQPTKKSKSSTRKISIAYASFLNSMLALERGNSHHALQFAKTAVKILFHDWTQMEELRTSSVDVSLEDVSQAESLDESSSLNGSRLGRPDLVRANTGPEFWALVYPLYRFISRLSTIYAYLGMYQETLYYAEQAQKVAKSMASSGYIAQSTAWLASVSLKAGDIKKATELAAEAKPLLFLSEPTYTSFNAVCQLISIYRESNDTDAEAEIVSQAETMLEEMKKDRQFIGDSRKLELEAGVAEVSVKETASVRPASRATKMPRATKAVGKPAATKAVAKRAKTPVEGQTQPKAEDAQLSFLRASILQCRSISLLENRDWTAAVTALRSACEFTKLSADVSQVHFLMGVALVGQSLEQMGRDSVFSFIQDSTLSFPSVAGSPKAKATTITASEKSSSPPRKARSMTVQDKQNFVENLREAQEHLLEAHAIASLNGDGNLVHRIAIALQNVVLLLSNTCSSKIATSHPAHATCSIELARNLTWGRERKTLRYDNTADLKSSWPIITSSSGARRSSLGFSIDMNRFQREYVDIIPKSWNVVSISVSDSKDDLCITKLQAGHSPFAIRLPLERANARDPDIEVFSFQQGRSELLELIQVANRTCHDARDMSQKGAKSAWWAEREELDRLMKQLLENIEESWLGGFRGIFTQHHKRSDLLARFHKSFQDILDKHLPSRRHIRIKRAKAAAPRINLDPRIIDLFIGLGDASVPGCDLDEPLTDLLYFVVDILQFHGERNAYDEIDFDAIAVETFDALHAYHDAAKNAQSERNDRDDTAHTILILDKSLHIFPWESLPCMQGAAVSRVPSLAYLRRAILEQQQPKDSSEEVRGQPPREGHYASINSGTYILNPSADLTNTQATFGRALAGLPPAWRSIETRAPTEAEFEEALTSSDLLLYFGHGSGAQYIRGRTVRRLEKCRAAALLMGCSSASLADVGQFECHGPVWNYMHAGCPAVVGTLWDVTDRDIDRFAGRVFEEWGLMPQGTFAEAAEAKGKGKARAKGKKGKEGEGSGKKVQNRDQQTSLVEAVARAREDACRFKYLTAAAVCVYGIPVYLSK